MLNSKISHFSCFAFYFFVQLIHIEIDGYYTAMGLQPVTSEVFTKAKSF
jgi:hypothetical protein